MKLSGEIQADMAKQREIEEEMDLPPQPRVYVDSSIPKIDKD